MKLHLGAAITVLHSDGAGEASAAASIHAVNACEGADMCGAGLDIISSRREGADRTGGQARFLGAAFAGAGATIGFRQVKPLVEGQGAAPSVPQTPVRMDQHADRGLKNWFGQLCPTKKRRPRWTAKRKYRVRVEVLRKFANDPQ
jgi:hypothetical protein